MKKIFTILSSFFALIAFSQTDSIAYSRDYDFTEGVFLTVNQFKENNPIPKLSIVSAIPNNQLDFLKQVTEQEILPLHSYGHNYCWVS